MAISIDQVPTSLQCPRCGHKIRGVPVSEGYEILVAQWLKGELAPALQVGFDIYQSALFPKRTFQVKHANPSNARRNDGVYESWAWGSNACILADYYILFGVKDSFAYCFLLTSELWEKFSAGKSRRLLTSPTHRFSRQGGGTRRGYPRENRLWFYECMGLPQDLIRRITELDEHYVSKEPLENPQCILETEECQQMNFF